MSTFSTFRISSLNNFGGLARSFNVTSPDPPPTPQPEIEIPKHWVSDWMELLLKKIAQNNLAPTHTSRWILIASNAIYNSYQFITQDKSPIDSQYWISSQKGEISGSIFYLESWIEQSCQYLIPKLIRNYMNLTLSPLTDDEVNILVNSHTPLSNINKSSLNELKVLLDSYLLNRDLDGWKLTGTFDGVLPNGSNTIAADNTIDQNLNDLPEPNKWTPLKIGSSTKNYLTPEWGTKNNGLLAQEDFYDLLNKTSTNLFPSNDQYEKEMKEVSVITQNLTDEQKILAEFWAGGPGTVTPPGMWVVFLSIVLRSNSIKLIQEIKSYAVLCSSLYQSSICAWRLKRTHLQARPLQKIRQYEYENPINQTWNSKKMGQYWLPYQELNFVTPPFPDFVSGHSTFSASSAKIFCYLLQSDMINLANPVSNSEILNYLSPILNNNTTNFSLNNFFVLPKTSTIEPGIVPSTSVNLNWICWTEMARSSGKSRIYGGIHIESSNQGGLYLGSMIGDKIWNMLKDI